VRSRQQREHDIDPNREGNARNRCSPAVVTANTSSSSAAGRKQLNTPNPVRDNTAHREDPPVDVTP